MPSFQSAGQRTEAFPTLKKFTLDGKTAVVTGGPCELGNDIAEALCDVHLNALVIFDVLQEHGDESAARLSASKSPRVVVAANASAPSSNLAAKVYDVAMIRRLLDINLTGVFVWAQAVRAAMFATRTGGAIVFIASMSGHIAHHGTPVNSISPGYMDTALNRVPALDAQKVLWKVRTPLGRLGAVDELNGLAVFLASDASSYMTGSDIIIDGGYTVW
ncbi:hypothetical protein FN846DRAFT_897552 [Sphaerosporella brunnea]|uniref:Uncharacterized protein n=1 Tax=Sphaerosporella brunnea TaxID=1250544 RepID=A0A5J5F694_9PEZI|nr:hypothetical protein FN846DRAFT_897552 [Sphaerosporella brunnea]